MVIKMKQVFKITIILILLFIGFLQTNNVFAGDVEGTTTQGPDERTYGWSDKSLDEWKPVNMDISKDEFNNRTKVVVAAIRGIGIVVAVVALMVIGIKQMTASVEEKSIIKQAMPGYILGVILVVSITFLPTIIYNFMQKVN